MLAFGKMARVYTVLREEAESVGKLKGLQAGGSLPAYTLHDGREGLARAISSFEVAQHADEDNEKMPPQRAEGMRRSGRKTGLLRVLKLQEMTWP